MQSTETQIAHVKRKSGQKISFALASESQKNSPYDVTSALAALPLLPRTSKKDGS
jgi:hypothetical protein